MAIPDSRIEASFLGLIPQMFSIFITILLSVTAQLTPDLLQEGSPNLASSLLLTSKWPAAMSIAYIRECLVCASH